MCELDKKKMVVAIGFGLVAFAYEVRACGQVVYYF